MNINELKCDILKSTPRKFNAILKKEHPVVQDLLDLQYNWKQTEEYLKFKHQYKYLLQSVSSSREKITNYNIYENGVDGIEYHATYKGIDLYIYCFEDGTINKLNVYTKIREVDNFSGDYFVDNDDDLENVYNAKIERIRNNKQELNKEYRRELKHFRIDHKEIIEKHDSILNWEKVK